MSDEGFDGVVISLGAEFSSCAVYDDPDIVVAGAACPLSSVVRKAFEAGRSGMEFAVGTPGSIGGALRMNAGTRNESIGMRVKSVVSYRPGAGLKRYGAPDISWGYRSCSLPSDEIVLECELLTKPGDAMIKARMEGAMARRRKTQPLTFASCGSVFKNPEGESVGRLIEGVGLKGRRCGDAQISDLHANFIVNLGHAHASDVVSLMLDVQNAVRVEYGIDLEPEVRFLGFA